MASKKTSEILELRRQGLRYKTIAAITGYSVNTVKSTCRRHPPLNEKVCLQCGAKIEQLPHRKEKKFCSDKCRMAWWNSHPERVNRKAFYHLSVLTAASLSTVMATTTANTAPAPVMRRHGERRLADGLL